MAVHCPDQTTRASRIPKQALDNWNGELSEWMHPSAFRDRIDQICLSIPRRVFFRQPGLTFLRDAWIASRVANALSSDLVRLVPVMEYRGPLGATKDQVILLFPTDGVHGGKVRVNRSRITSPRPLALLVCRKRCDNLRSD